MTSFSIRHIYGKYSIFLIFTFVFIIIQLFFSNSINATVIIDEPMSIEDHVLWNDDDVILNADVRITEYSSLKIMSCMVEFRSTYPLEVGITIEPNGILIIQGIETETILRRGPANESYFIRAYQQSRISINNTTIKGLGQKIVQSSMWKSGNCLRSDNVSFSNCTFIDCRIGIGLEGGEGPTIFKCKFINCYQGIWTNSVFNTRIEGCSFYDCTYAVYCYELFSSKGLRMNVSNSYFEDCHNGISFIGSYLQVTNCNFERGKRALYLRSAQQIELQNVSINNLEFGLYIKSAEMGSIEDFKIFRCLTSIFLKNSRLLLREGHVETSNIAFHIENSSIDIKSVEVIGSNHGIFVSNDIEANQIHQTVRVLNTVFENVTQPIEASNVWQVVLQNCEFLGVRMNINGTGINIFRFANNNAILDFLFFELSGIQRFEFESFTISGEFIVLNLMDSLLHYRNPNNVSTIFYMNLDDKSEVLSSISPNLFRLRIIDEASRFKWVKTIHFNVTKASDNSPALGYDFQVMNNHSMEVVNRTIGFSGMVTEEDLVLFEMTSDGNAYQSPHSNIITLNDFKQIFTINFEEWMEFSIIIDLIIDDTPPVLTIIEPINESVYYKNSVNITGTANDRYGMVGNVTIEIDFTSRYQVDANWSLRVDFEMGWHHLLFIATDNHFNTIKTEVWFEIRESLASLEVFHPINGTLTNKSWILVEGRILGATWLTINAYVIDTDSNGKFIENVSLENDTNIIDFQYGNTIEQRNLYIVVERDIHLPEIQLNDIPSITNNNQIEIQGSIIERHPPSVIWISNNPIELNANFSFYTDLVLPDGYQEIVIWVSDLAGNTNRTSVKITVDSILELGFIERPPTVLNTEQISFRIKCEEGAILIISNNENVIQQFISESQSMDLSIRLNMGINNVSIHGTDIAGNSGFLNVTINREPEIIEVKDPLINKWLVFAIFLVAIIILSVYFVIKTTKS